MAQAPDVISRTGDIVQLPSPHYDGKVSVEAALKSRRSIREFSNKPLTLPEVSQILWAAQGVTDSEGRRTAPSAGGLYPLETYLAAGNVEGLSNGIYHYQAKINSLVRISTGDPRPKLWKAALEQTPVKEGAIILIFSGVVERSSEKYGSRAERYVMMEAGHAAQNVYLQAESLKLGAVVVGAFEDDQINKIVSMKGNEQPLYLMPVGRRVHENF
jgi:SagB-type dehydrogenase family enzyme